ncbi:MAG: sulfatase [Opitutaceae bacterium]|nr:sulfatase [Opitutaceae bacterium]
MARPLLLTLLFAFVAAASAFGAAAKRPNILFAIADDQSFPYASAYGTTWVKTPAFDRVAREGLLFMRAYTPNAKCAPSRACILTGRNSWQLEEAANHVNNFPAKFRGFMEALAANGYAIGFTGKGWGPGNPGVIEGKPRQLTGPAFSQQKTKPPTSAIANVDYAANFEAFLQQRRGNDPFCFWFGGFEPHRRYEYGSGVKLGGKDPRQIERVPAFWPDNETVRNDLLDYAFEVEYFDSHLGRIIAALEKAGELDHTLIVVTADNGMPFPRSKGTTYEISNHMPLAMRWPGGIAKPGRRVDDYVSFIDFAPTFLDVAGVTEQKSGMQSITGRSLAPIFRDTTPAPGRLQPGRDVLLIGQERHDTGRPNDVGYPVRGIYRDGFLYLHNFEPTRWPMCDPITGYLNSDGSPTKTLILAENRMAMNHWRWELNFGRHPREELYDLRKDGDCITNLAADPRHNEQRERMQQELFAALKAQDDPRMFGRGEIFDRYPHLANAHFYESYMKGEKQRAGWVEDTDFEKPGFDPERPAESAARMLPMIR